MRMTLSLVVLLAAVVPSLAQLPPDKALASMQPGLGLQVELFAAEPMLINPTAIDVDHKGRVWVCEGVNYRCKLRNRPLYRKEGDRIEILIDETGEGKATKAVTFYQGVDLMAPLGVCVIPQADGKALRVLVAQSPDILEFWDKDGDLKADGPPTKFLTGFGGIDHDHGVHGLSIGPDGKLYFTVGDQGVKGLKSKDGKGKSWTTNRTDCQAATVWRCDLDGNNLELIAHNFRNNYECCVDSFGEIWLSDNDDDGNQQTRICHVLPGGNYGYWPRGPGQSHWHEEQPGIVHKTLRTGFGSPTGITFYEGSLLPKQYQGDLIHCDAGPREVRYFKRIPKGAGYELEKTVMLTSTDNWFRPSAVRVAPDGSVFIADWYDPGVGGHGMGDWKMGRIYRLTSGGHKGYKVPEVKLDEKGWWAALSSPCLATRSAALNRLKSDEDEASRKLVISGMPKQMNAVLASRAEWLNWTQFKNNTFFWREPTGNMTQEQQFYTLLIRAQRRNIEPEIATEQCLNVAMQIAKGNKVFSIASGREALIGLQDEKQTDAIKPFYIFAGLYDGSDRFYLSALNIACGTDPVRRDAILADFEKHFPEWNDKVADLVWELRPKSMLPKMNKLLDDPKLTAKQKARIVDIIAVNDDLSAGKTVLGLLGSNYSAEVKTRAVENLKMFLPTKWKELLKTPEFKKVCLDLLAVHESNPQLVTGMKLAVLANDPATIDAIYKVWLRSNEGVVLEEAASSLGQIPNPAAVEKLKSMLTGEGGTGKFGLGSILMALGEQAKGGNKDALALLQSYVADETKLRNTSSPVRQSALEALASSRAGTGWLLKLKADGKFPPELTADAGKLLRNSPFQGERNRAYQLFPVTTKLDVAKLPPIGDLARLSGNSEKGKALFAASLKNDMQCMKCHKVNGQGGEIGPDLSAIGTKGSRQNLFESILYPSRAIADQHVSWVIGTADGQTITGLLVKETDTALTIRDANGKDTVVDIKNVESRKKSAVSLMSEDLVKTMTETELVDLVAYLETLKAVEKK
jgi:putative membrane-bound dehydrogenase-like protein